MLHSQPIEQPVGLCPRGTHRRTFAGVEAAKLNAGGVDVFRHFTAQGVDLLNNLPLGQAADGGVAGHGADGIGVDDADQGAAAHAGSGQRGLATGMTRADDGDVKISHVYGSWQAGMAGESENGPAIDPGRDVN